MGLDDFKTEGPRTYSTDKNSSSQVEDEVIHVLRGTDPDTSMVPNTVTIHKAVIRETLKELLSSEREDMCVCDECKRTASDFETIVKVDKLEFREVEWFEEFMSSVLEGANNASRSEVLDDLSTQSREEDDDEEEETVTSKSTGGLESFKT